MKNAMGPIRTIHHLSCSGGTLLSKCISVCGNSLFISEVDPLTTWGTVRFAPMDMVSQIQGQYRNLSRQDKADYFQAQIEILQRLSERTQRPLCLRDHSHGSFITHDLRCSNTLELLHEAGHQTLSVATIRHPLDAFGSMLRNSWGKGAQNSLEEYCIRVLNFVDYFKAQGIRVWRYEDFCINPSALLREFCKALELEFNPNFRDDFGKTKLTGDSGRSSPHIELRERTKIPADIVKQTKNSKSYATLCARFNYAEPVEAFALMSP